MQWLISRGRLPARLLRGFSGHPCRSCVPGLRVARGPRALAQSRTRLPAGEVASQAIMRRATPGATRAAERTSSYRIRSLRTANANSIPEAARGQLEMSHESLYAGNLDESTRQLDSELPSVYGLSSKPTFQNRDVGRGEEPGNRRATPYVTISHRLQDLL